MTYQTIKVEFHGPVCYLQFHRPEADNAINDLLVSECHDVLSICEETAKVIVLSGSPEVFCLGADFRAIGATPHGFKDNGDGPESLYELWLRLATGPFVTIANVRGKANAGGIGFVAASDIVLAEESARFSLSELLFGLYPACVLPFLVRRVGFQKAHYLTLMSQTIPAHQAFAWGLVDVVAPANDVLLRKHLQRLSRLSKNAIRRYKSYAGRISAPLQELRTPAVAANREMFSDSGNLRAIVQYVERGVFPWEELMEHPRMSAE
ncbi:MAG: enoyl-CoA hydratase/isomerase [Terracidiphilus sp.]|jgi:polyketide biosynthesis enoyl-CoA hydratase PksH